MNTASQLPLSRVVDCSLAALAGLGGSAATATLAIAGGSATVTPAGNVAFDSGTTPAAAAADAAFGCVDWYQYPAEANPANLPH
jgi:hypothetical protein